MQSDDVVDSNKTRQTATIKTTPRTTADIEQPPPTDERFADAMRRVACRTISRSRSRSRSRSSLSPQPPSSAPAAAAALSADEVATLQAWQRDVRDVETRQLAEAERVASTATSLRSDRQHQPITLANVDSSPAIIDFDDPHQHNSINMQQPYIRQSAPLQPLPPPSTPPSTPPEPLNAGERAELTAHYERLARDLERALVDTIQVEAASSENVATTITATANNDALGVRVHRRHQPQLAAAAAALAQHGGGGHEAHAAADALRRRFEEQVNDMVDQYRR